MSGNMDYCINVEHSSIVKDSDGKLKFMCNEEIRSKVLEKFHIDIQGDQEFLAIAEKCDGHVFFSIKDGKAVYAK